MSGNVKLDTTKLNQLLATVQKNANEVVSGIAEQVTAEAKNNIMEWPLFDTGALANSIIAQQDKPGLWQVGDFGEYRGSKESRFKKGKAHVAPSMEYAVYWELGHHNIFTRHYMHMPFLQPAIYKVERDFADSLARGIFK
jgi:hypothetical protein